MSELTIIAIAGIGAVVSMFSLTVLTRHHSAAFNENKE